MGADEPEDDEPDIAMVSQEQFDALHGEHTALQRAHAAHETELANRAVCVFFFFFFFWKKIRRRKKVVTGGGRREEKIKKNI